MAGKKVKRSKIDEYGMPVNCTGCRKFVLQGHGNQRQVKSRIDRYCDKCWTPIAEEKW